MELVKGITSDHDLLALARRIEVRINGIYELSEIRKPLPSKVSYLILLRTSPGIGHWTAVCDLAYFDKQIQGSSDEYCGIFCMLFLYAKQHGQMQLFDRFTDLDIDVLPTKKKDSY
ncbi:hypothetical protein PHYSODRAFT_469604 [Phytophthora sojae]|uniref:Ubiquitin-like protease family profile domain-containing protein n=1 Tax=Phytophthora sojae (strain P6497) TaxID=1094619 RepID=G4YLB7_PHYSP|nr:hypothetical protein PHYSODRAFT_469604 [Phytophthora sojae]EGZ30185.1 hypothetical protein PHYSODRAFT_469604 [Phytophthora sojae]|eukprot:XP_009517460.1 hypothetical protein PHYSODRAFT_469604 [Phytophthora sojae]